jgi:hypothetical protein
MPDLRGVILLCVVSVLASLAVTASALAATSYFSNPTSGTNVCGTRVHRPANYGSGDVWPALAPAGPYASSLSAFDFTNPNGEWSMFVQDDAAGNTWFFTNRFQLQITTDSSAPTATSVSPADKASGVGLASLRGLPLLYSPKLVEVWSSREFAPGVGGWHHAYGGKGRAPAKRERGRNGEPTCRSRRWRNSQSRRPSNAGMHWSKGSSEAPSGSWRS